MVMFIKLLLHFGVLDVVFHFFYFFYVNTQIKKTNIKFFYWTTENKGIYYSFNFNY